MELQIGQILTLGCPHLVEIRQDETRITHEGISRIHVSPLMIMGVELIFGITKLAILKSDMRNIYQIILARFPLALALDHITTWTNPGDVVLDPMAGSGTTLRAAKNLGRKAIGIEIHEDYLHIITGRMAQSVMAF